MERPKSYVPSHIAYTPISQIMCRDPVHVRSDDNLMSVAPLLLERGVDGAPVVDADGRVEGILRLADLLASPLSSWMEPGEVGPDRLGVAWHFDRIEEATVSALTLHGIPRFAEAVPIATAAAVMSYEGLTWAPVVRSDDRLVGVLSSLDILRWLAHEDGYVVAGTHRVLVADDDEDMRHLVSHALRKDDWDVVEAADGEALLDYVGASMLGEPHAKRPELIISDIRMPGFSGLQILAGLKRAQLATPVVLMTALSDQQVYTDAERLGAAAIFRKPFDPDQLRRLARELVN
jgi:CheY-like chemotaxis protein